MVRNTGGVCCLWKGWYGSTIAEGGQQITKPHMPPETTANSRCRTQLHPHTHAFNRLEKHVHASRFRKKETKLLPWLLLKFKGRFGSGVERGRRCRRQHVVTTLKPRHLPLSIFSITWQCNRKTTIAPLGPTHGGTRARGEHCRLKTQSAENTYENPTPLRASESRYVMQYKYCISAHKKIRVYLCRYILQFECPHAEMCDMNVLTTVAVVAAECVSKCVCICVCAYVFVCTCVCACVCVCVWAWIQ